MVVQEIRDKEILVKLDGNDLILIEEALENYNPDDGITNAKRRKKLINDLQLCYSISVYHKLPMILGEKKPVIEDNEEK